MEFHHTHPQLAPLWREVWSSEVKTRWEEGGKGTKRGEFCSESERLQQWMEISYHTNSSQFNLHHFTTVSGLGSHKVNGSWMVALSSQIFVTFLVSSFFLFKTKCEILDVFFASGEGGGVLLFSFEKFWLGLTRSPWKVTNLFKYFELEVKMKKICPWTSVLESKCRL